MFTIVNVELRKDSKLYNHVILCINLINPLNLSRQGWLTRRAMCGRYSTRDYYVALSIFLLLR